MIPPLGDGYFTYEKRAKYLSYHDRQGEKLWKREYPYYPVSDYYGNLILLLSSDNSRVDFINSNGLATGVKSVSGNLLTDYSFATHQSQAGLVFSSGEAYVIRENGTIAFQHNFATKQSMVFVKSCALSPDAKLLAVHLLKDEKDIVVILKAKEREVENKSSLILGQITLPEVYPHVLYLAVNAHGVLVATRNRTLFFSLAEGADNRVSDWDEKSSDPCLENCRFYRPVYASHHFFLYGKAMDWTLVDQKGRRLLSKAITAQASFAAEKKQTNSHTYPFLRFLPGGRPDLFIVQTGPRLEYYSYQSKLHKN